MSKKEEKKEKPADAEAKAGKKKARGALWLFLNKLKSKCGSFKSVAEWDKFIKEELVPVLTQFSGAISPEWHERLKNAYKLKDKTLEAVNTSCKLLQKELKVLIKYLPKGGIFTNPLVKIVLGVAAGGSILVTVLNTIAVTITIQNQGCQTIYPIVYSFIKIPGLSLPSNPIPDKGVGKATLPPINLITDITGNNLKLTAVGINMNFALDSSGVNLVFDGNSLMGKVSEISLRNAKEHTLVVSCR